jgi:endoglucanase
MKTYFFYLFAGMFLLFISNEVAGNQVVRVNQLGYLPQSVKVAVFLSDENVNLKKFTLHEALTGKEVFSGNVQPKWPGIGEW